jgi:hypothetical protein
MEMEPKWWAWIRENAPGYVVEKITELFDEIKTLRSEISSAQAILSVIDDCEALVGKTEEDLANWPGRSGTARMMVARLSDFAAQYIKDNEALADRDAEIARLRELVKTSFVEGRHVYVDSAPSVDDFYWNISECRAAMEAKP